MAARYHAAFWNLENLFAPESYPDREPWIASAVASELKGWTDALFARKLAQLASVISRMNEGAGPDLLGVCEIENKFVLDALIEVVAALLPDRQYKTIHADAKRDRRGIDTAFLYDSRRFKAKDLFHHAVLRRTGTRDITQATFVTKAGAELVAMANHWPSRSGGAELSRGFRMTAGETVGYWHERIREEKGEDVALIVMGDFNDDPFDASLTIHAGATREHSDVLRARSAKLYNLSWRYLAQELVDVAGKHRVVDGTIYYQGDANLFDQILVSRGLLLSRAPLAAQVDTARIEAFPEQVSKSVATPEPIRFGLPRGNASRNINRDGFSDHYPVSVILVEAGA
ncbi:endonuclease/exonuclease/phosphatase family protein [Bordetella petrii]|uniref:endonuclease/exonuclease/phosphatase family protein n=1 Tax=Bordetella petrii TaxID=94624 RepID=UPI001E60AC3D|nr:endonuclease/exonuclease/phosphatase family protein [Bordetella petrii]MCD0502924.1 endonuclease [Bordetella petrii]